METKDTPDKLSDGNARIFNDEEQKRIDELARQYGFKDTSPPPANPSIDNAGYHPAFAPEDIDGTSGGAEPARVFSAEDLQRIGELTKDTAEQAKATIPVEPGEQRGKYAAYRGDVTLKLGTGLIAEDEPFGNDGNTQVLSADGPAPSASDAEIKLSAEYQKIINELVYIVKNLHNKKASEHIIDQLNKLGGHIDSRRPDTNFEPIPYKKSADLVERLIEFVNGLKPPKLFNKGEFISAQSSLLKGLQQLLGEFNFKINPDFYNPKLDDITAHYRALKSELKFLYEQSKATGEAYQLLGNIRKILSDTNVESSGPFNPRVSFVKLLEELEIKIHKLRQEAIFIRTKQFKNHIANTKKIIAWIIAANKKQFTTRTE